MEDLAMLGCASSAEVSGNETAATVTLFLVMVLEG